MSHSASAYQQLLSRYQQVQQLVEAVVSYAERHGVLLLPPPRSYHNGLSCCEITVGTATMAHGPQFWAQHLQQCLAPVFEAQGESLC